MDFAITPETQGLLDTAATFEDRLISEARDREAAGSIGAELTQEMGRAGLIAPELSTHLGGQGQTKVTRDWSPRRSLGAISTWHICRWWAR